MKLLFDQHISQRVVRAIKITFPECRHVKYFHLEQAPDEVIWDFARQNGYSIVTKDDDFHQRSLLFGHPPKIIWVKLGNSDNATMEDFLRDRSATMQSFLDDRDASLLVLRKETP
jgi:predicted nuclease of predicted toxin-antitoxin system